MTMKYRSFCLATLTLATLSVAACGSTSMTLTGAKQPSRQPDCEFQVLTAIPGGGYVELGTVDVQPGDMRSNVYTKLDEFKAKIQPYVCEAGGDAAIATANGYGMYIKATILKSVGSGSAPAAMPQASGGCQFDTQCKGDRVCVRGACIDPASK